MQINKECISVEQLLKLLQLADEDNALGLSQLERKWKWFMDIIHQLDKQIERSKNYLYRLNNVITNARKLLSDFNISCEQNLVKTKDNTFKMMSLLTNSTH